MPIIQINMMQGRSVQQKRAMVAAITAAVHATIGAAPQSVRIIINELKPENYSVAGHTAEAQPLGSHGNSASGDTQREESP